MSFIYTTQAGTYHGISAQQVSCYERTNFFISYGGIK